MSFRHSKKKSRTQSYLFYLILCLSMAVIFSFLYGLLKGTETPNTILSTVIACSDLGLLGCTAYYLHKIYQLSSKNEVANILKAQKQGETYDIYNRYDQILYRDAFFDEVRKVLSTNISLGCLAVFQIEAIEVLQRIIGRRKMDSVIADIIDTLQDISNVKCISGCKSSNEFWVFLYGTRQELLLRHLDTTIGKLDSITRNFSDLENSSYVKCGYTWYPEQAVTCASLVNNADYALYEAIIFKKTLRHEFSLASYHKQEEDFRRNAIFNRFIEREEFTFFFQPIVNARNGSIFGYESLIRTISPNEMAPPEIIEIATRQNRLYEIEKYTFFHVMHLVSQNMSFLKERKLFINSIPNFELNSQDFDTLFNAYSNYMTQLVIEITESQVQTEESMTRVHQYLKITGAELALDDYGSGYSNESNLLKTNPHYIKLDYSLVNGIDQDIKKQHLVANIIQYAKQYGISCLAEGVETFEELNTVIHLGVDLIQGFYTARPKAEFVEKVSDSVRDDIIHCNLQRQNNLENNRVFDSKAVSIINLVDVALNGYTAVSVYQNQMTLQGENGQEVMLSVLIKDGCDTTIHLKNASIHGNNGPAIIIGQNCHVNLVIEGINSLTYSGIRVPASSKLTISGNGTLNIHAESDHTIGIGGNYEQEYGSIQCSLDGYLNITTRSDYSIGIGGNNTNAKSEILLDSGNISITSFSNYAIGIGSLNGNANVTLRNSQIKIYCSGTVGVGIGCYQGDLELDTSSDLSITINAGTGIGIGCVTSISTGNIMFSDGTVKLKLNSVHGSGIGSNNGSVNITLANTNISAFVEGSYICGIGNYTGRGNVHILSGVILVSVMATQAIPLSSTNGMLFITGGNINCNLPLTVTAYNELEDQLVYYHVDDKKELIRQITSPHGSYTYYAQTSNEVPDLHVYLPSYVVNELNA